MSDFDFDELDKAVAGAISPDESAVQKPASEQTDTNDTSNVSAPQEATSSAPVVAAPVVTEAPSTDTSRVTPAARRSSGRFMDVVHPSSDMRSRTSPVSISPTGESNKPTFTPPTDTPKTEEQPETASALNFEVTNEWNQPLESPFLPDAKVEKRPLGAFSPDENAALASAPEEELKLEAPDDLRLEATTMPDPIDFAAHALALPSESEDTAVVVEESVPESEELTIESSSELSQAFANSLIEDPIEPVDAVEPEAEVKAEEETPTPEAAIEVPQPEPIIETPAEEPIVGPTSITQQYEEQPAGEQASGAIYDTENYHQPLAVTGKKHSGAWTIFWIILLVILGAGAGVAFYLFVLPML